MDNRDLFKFPFVDRKIERKMISQFSNEASANSIFWLSGETGTGKSYLLENFIRTFEASKQSSHKIVYINKNASDVSTSYIGILIEKLQDIAGMKFSEFIKANYTSILDISKRITIELLKSKNIDIENFLDLAYDQSKVFIEKNEKRQGSSKVISAYINHILKKYSLLIICDNLTYCDEEELNILIDIMGIYLTNDKVKFILVTTSGVEGKFEKIESIIIENLPLQPLILKPFDKYDYFLEILMSIFQIQYSDTNFIKDIFYICEGYPERLKSFIRNLFVKDGILIDTNSQKALFHSETLFEHISKKLIDLDVKSLDVPTQFVLQILSNLGVLVDLELFYSISNYMTSKILYLSTTTDTMIKNSLFKLLNLRIIEIVFKDGREKISFLHDSQFILLSQYYVKNSPINNMLSTYFYKYLIQNCGDPILNSLTKKDLRYLLAWHSYNGKSIEWMTENYNYANYLLEANLFAEAKMVFDRFRTFLSNLTDSQMLTMSKCYYDTGDYYGTDELLQLITISELKENELYDFYFMRSKVKNILLQKYEALDNINLALKYAPLDSDSMISTLNIKHSILWEMEKGRDEAKEIFDSTIKNLKGTTSLLPSVSRLYRNCSNYCNSKKAIEYLNRAEEIADYNKDDIEKAYVINNRGFEYFKRFELSKSAQHFLDSIELLNNLKIHESSYPLNNLAVIKMLNSDFEEAIELLKKSWIWHRSYYIKTTIQVNLMTCYAMINLKEESLKIASEIISNNTIAKTDDLTVIRKLYNNLAFIYDRFGMCEDARKYISEGYKYSKNTSSIFRAYSIMEKYFPDTPYPNISIPPIHMKYYTEAPYDHWLLTSSHD